MTYTPLQRLFKLLKPNSKAITNLYFFSVVKAIIALSLPLGIQAIINLIQGGEISVSWVVLVGIVLLGYFFSGIIQIIELKITEGLQKDIFARSAFDFAFRIPRIQLDALHNKYTPELMNRFFDTITVQKGVAKILLELVGTGISIIFGLILISFYHPFFILFSFLVVLLFFVIGNYVFQRGLKSSIIESKYKYKVAFWLEEVARTQDTFRLSGTSMLPVKKTDLLVSDYLKARDNHFRLLVGQYYLFMIFKILVAAGFLILGGVLVFNQQMNLGQFVAAEIIILLLISATEKVLLTFETVYDLLTSIEKLGEVTDLPLEKNTLDQIKSDPTKQGMSVKVLDLAFKYPKQTENVIDNLNFSIDAGEIVSISGSSGAGKATLLKLMTAFYTPQKGSILYDDIPINNYNIVQLRSVMTECISESNIFDGSILENITLGEDYEMSDIIRTIKLVNLYSYIEGLPDGLNTHIGPQGKLLSGSVAQKLILVRVLMRNSKLLIIEDIFKNLEREEKINILKNVFKIKKGITIVVVTKDTDIQQMTDKTFFMEKGKVQLITQHKN
jgi:ABC-type bacteriocin/lantibiotic exporter with double-glycine peptidase domain